MGPINCAMKRLGSSSFFDVIIIGSGVGGLATALYLPQTFQVAVVSKTCLKSNATYMAQGGIAAAIGCGDDPNLHEEDTLKAGHGLNLREAVHILTSEAPNSIEDLLQWGMSFDKLNGKFHFALEGAHSRHRILHANGDATGESLWMTLYQRALERENIVFLPNMYAIDLLGEEKVNGVKLVDEECCVWHLYGSFVVVATGGVGQLYEVTSNPPSSTGDGIAMAYDSGAEITDMEFEQFHPTLFFSANYSDMFLISEAVRGAGAVLLNIAKEPFMYRYDPLGDLAPRDIVVRAIHTEMKRLHARHVYLDLRPVGENKLRAEFPGLVSRLQQKGLDPSKDLIPVVPAAHFTMGGIKVDLWGRSSVKGLYAVGECACTYAHGANRLASNSLLESLVFARRVAQNIAEHGIWHYDKALEPCSEELIGRFPNYNEQTENLRRSMQAFMGIARDESGLTLFMSELNRLKESLPKNENSRQTIELLKKVTVCSLMARTAFWRKESRGAHFRCDHPTEDCSYRKHFVVSKQGEREIDAKAVEDYGW